MRTTALIAVPERRRNGSVRLCGIFVFCSFLQYFCILYSFTPGSISVIQMCDPGIKNFNKCHSGQAHTEPDYSNDDTIWSSDENINPGLHDSFKASRNINMFGEPTLFL